MLLAHMRALGHPNHRPLRTPILCAIHATVSGMLATALAVSALGQDAAKPKVEDHRRHALTHRGDPARGAALFGDPTRAACANCHTVDGSAGKAGPDLRAAGDAFGRRDLIQAVLEPSATIAPGYGTVAVETRAGDLHQGVLKGATDTEVRLMGGDGRLVTIRRADIRSQQGGTVSLMPEGLQAGLSLEEFTDLIEYLASLKQPESALAENRGMPRVIPTLRQPVGIHPFLGEHERLRAGPAHTGLTAMHPLPGLTNGFLVLHQSGVIWRLQKSGDGETRTVFADLSSEVFCQRGPNGLLDLAFHPDCRRNRRYFLKHQVFEGGTVATVIVERRLSADLRSDAGTPGRRLIRIDSVAEDHSGGCLQFGPDGFLYFAMGDTGPHHDPNGHAQNLGLLLGKMLRIDVDHEEPPRAYAIPKDNPFRDTPGVPPEIWASGFRNPWRFSFDPATGNLWMADVGQDRVEEVSLVKRGENHGWNVYEGFEPFSNQYRKAGRAFTPPVFAYGRKYGNSITGGHVYRGARGSSFDGVYLCGDFTSRRIFGLTLQGGVLKTVRQIGTVPQGLVSFGRDEAGNLYVVGFEGTVYRIDFDDTRFDGEVAE